MAGKIIADIIEAPYDKITLNVGNTTVLTANGSGITYIPSSNLNVNLGNTANISVGTLTANAIKFPATQVPSSDANTLDDYEEGTWTPEYTLTTSGTVTMSLQEGTYVKIGKTVYISCRLSSSATSSPVGNITVNGLPFASDSTTRYAMAVSDLRAWQTAFTTQIGATVEQTNSFITLMKQASNTAFVGVAAGDLSSSSGANNIQISGYYRTTS